MVYLVDKEFSNVSISQINSLKFWKFINKIFMININHMIFAQYR